MAALINPQIKDAPPERVYVFPEKLTKEEIESNVKKLHTIANEEADRNIYCLFDYKNTPIKYQVCFPVTHLDMKKYKVDEFIVIPREKVASCNFNGDFDTLMETIALLTKYAQDNGHTVYFPYRFLFTLHKKPLLSKQPPKFTMQIQIPIH